MKNLIINVGAKTIMTFSSASVMLVREANNSKSVNVNYANGTGQTLSAGQVLFEEGVYNTLNYIRIKSTNAVTFTGSNSFNLTVESYPNSTQSSRSIDIPVFGSALNLVVNLSYNSKPVTSDVVLETPNRTARVITASDILPNVSDYDGDTITEIALYGDVSAFTFNDVAYVQGTFMSMTDLNNGLLEANPLDQR